MIHIRFLHDIKELAGICAEGFNVTTLTLGIDRIKRKRGLPRTRQAGDDHQFVAWNVHINGFQVILTRNAYFDIFQLSHLMPLLTI